jgi:hypothetical protein
MRGKIPLNSFQSKLWTLPETRDVDRFPDRELLSVPVSLLRKLWPSVAGTPGAAETKLREFLDPYGLL